MIMIIKNENVDDNNKKYKNGRAKSEFKIERSTSNFTNDFSNNNNKRAHALFNIFSKFYFSFIW